MRALWVGTLESLLSTCSTPGSCFIVAFIVALCDMMFVCSFVAERIGDREARDRVTCGR